AGPRLRRHRHPRHHVWIPGQRRASRHRLGHRAVALHGSPLGRRSGARRPALSVTAMARARSTAMMLMLALGVCLGRGSLHAAALRSPVGLWEGTIQGMLRVVVHVDSSPGGSLKGTMDSPDQGAMGLPIDTLIFANDSLRFTMVRIRGDFAGAMSA